MELYGVKNLRARERFNQAGRQKDMNINMYIWVYMCKENEVLHETSNAIRSFRLCAYNVFFNFFLNCLSLT